MARGRQTEYIEDTQTLVASRKRDLLDVETGEHILVDQITKRIYGQKAFWKCYLMDFLSILGIFDSRQCDVFIYIVENTNPSTNLFIGTYRKIADDTGASSTTIAKIMKKLVEHGFIKKVQNGLWFVNPNVLMKGNDGKRQMLLSYYESDEPINQFTMSRTKRKPIDQIDGQMEIADIDCNIAERIK